MAFLQTRIFVSITQQSDLDCWYETLLGRIIRPIVEDHPELEWFWFSRYVCNDDNGDCDITKLPPQYFFSNGTNHNWHVSIRFRFSLPEHMVEEFKRKESQRITNASYYITDWRPFERLKDLGNDLHIGEVPPSDPKREERAELVTGVYHSLSRIILHSLIEMEGGKFRFEKEDPWMAFERVIHLTHNMTDTSIKMVPVSF